MPPNYQPKSETERALQESLRNMELQCKERVDLLDALRKSRKEAQEKETGEKSSGNSTSRGRPPVPKKHTNPVNQYSSAGWIGEGTVPAVSYPDYSKDAPPLPQRPVISRTGSDYSIERSYSSSQIHTLPLPSPYATPTLPVPQKKTSRTPSPDKKGRVMLTTLRTKDGKKPSKSPRSSAGRFNAPPASSKAAGLAWDSTSKNTGQRLGQTLLGLNGSTTTLSSVRRDSAGGNSSSRPESTNVTDGEDQALGGNALVRPEPRAQVDMISSPTLPRANNHVSTATSAVSNGVSITGPQPGADLINLDPPPPPAYEVLDSTAVKIRTKSPIRPKVPEFPSYRTEFPPTQPSSRALAEFNARQIRRQEDKSKVADTPTRQRSPQKKTRPPIPSNIARRPVANISTPRSSRYGNEEATGPQSSESNDENTSSSHENEVRKRPVPRKGREISIPFDPALESSENEKKRSSSDAKGSSNIATSATAWHDRVKYVKKHLPKGVDESAAKQIFNEIVVQGDEVHWDDVAGLEVAKKALKEAVVYPFLRPDLFMGLREPARGMLLFGPPGTGKTMLARAVATESRSTFFAISASSLTSKWLGESEKLVRALFSLAKALAPSIIFVDEIDSLLSSRGGSSEHESTRRIKTEFLIQWSDLQRAAAGSKQSDKDKIEGDASRVLVLAATNMPWAIDEAARRRFVRRQYIPLPEAPVRGEQLRTLLGHQKHNLNKKDIAVLVELTDSMFLSPLNLHLPLTHRLTLVISRRLLR